jgi:hypothetical protein
MSKGKFQGSSPLAAGSYGDVWKQTINGHTVAFKVLRLYERSDVEILTKASISLFVSLPQPDIVFA